MLCGRGGGHRAADRWCPRAFLPQVTPIAVKILNKDGLPGDSGLGGNGDFCQLFDPVTGDAFGYKDGTSGHVMCAVTNVDREAGFYNISLVQADEYGEARIYDSAWAYDLEGRAYSLAFSPKVNEVTPAAGSRAGGTVRVCVRVSPALVPVDSLTHWLRCLSLPLRVLAGSC